MFSVSNFSWFVCIILQAIICWFFLISLTSKHWRALGFSPQNSPFLLLTPLALVQFLSFKPCAECWWLLGAYLNMDLSEHRMYISAYPALPLGCLQGISNLHPHPNFGSPSSYYFEMFPISVRGNPIPPASQVQILQLLFTPVFLSCDASCTSAFPDISRIVPLLTTFTDGPPCLAIVGYFFFPVIILIASWLASLLPPGSRQFSCNIA